MNKIISMISFLNETINSIMNQLKPLFIAIYSCGDDLWTNAIVISGALGGTQLTQSLHSSFLALSSELLGGGVVLCKDKYELFSMSRILYSTGSVWCGAFLKMFMR